MLIDCLGKTLDLTSPAIMGILNVTPDSFSDGGKFHVIDQAIEHALRMTAAGASIIDIGGESTRPGAIAVSSADEIERVIPVISTLSREIDIPISIDTTKPEVMSAAIQAGAGFINDVNALQEKNALEVAAQAGVPVCLMHMQGSPRTMQKAPSYGNVVEDIKHFLQTRITACIDAGIAQKNIIIDPGFGFGKTLEHNLQLLTDLDELLALDVPILVGLSRKSMIGQLLDLAVDERMLPSVVLALMSIERGASIVRVHDVQETAQALTLLNAIT